MKMSKLKNFVSTISRSRDAIKHKPYSTKPIGHLLGAPDEITLNLPFTPKKDLPAVLKVKAIDVGKPSASVEAMSYSHQHLEHSLGFSDQIRTTLLLPENEEHFQVFKNIITSKDVVFTSSWIDKWFGIRNLRQRCTMFEAQLDLIKGGAEDIPMDAKIFKSWEGGADKTQLALDQFFSSLSSNRKIKEIYSHMTERAAETGLGYYKFEDEEGSLLGGGALAPISKGSPVIAVDVALHILKPRKGIGTICLENLLNKAFEECKVKEVWGSSVINHPGTPTLCAKHGMIIVDKDGMKNYYIDSDMRKAMKGKLEKVTNNPIAASTYYGNEGGGGRG